VPLAGVGPKTPLNDLGSGLRRLIGLVVFLKKRMRVLARLKKGELHVYSSVFKIVVYELVRGVGESEDVSV